MISHDAQTLTATGTMTAALPISPMGDAGEPPAGGDGMPAEPYQAWIETLQPRITAPGIPGTQLAHDAYDVAAWQSTLGAFGRLQKAAAASRRHGAFAPALLQDLFWSFVRRIGMCEISPIGR